MAEMTPKLAWEQLTSYLLDPEKVGIRVGLSDVKDWFHVLKAVDLDSEVLGWYLDLLRHRFTEIAPKFWSHFPSPAGASTEFPDSIQSDVFQAVGMVHELHNKYKIGTDILAETLEGCAQNPKEHTPMSARAFCSRARASTTSAVFTACPAYHREAMFAYFEKSFVDLLTYRERARGSDVDMDSDSLSGDSDLGEEDLDIVHGRLEAFKLCAARLRELGWLGRFEEVFTNMLYIRLDRYIETTCDDEFEEPLLGKILAHVESHVFDWLSILFDASDGDTNSSATLDLEAWKSRLTFHMYERFCTLRTTSLFDIIKMYPDSRLALIDLRDALERTRQHKSVVLSLRQVLQQRLLHPGANTSQIIDVYVATIKALRLLDPTGVLLESVAEPVKDYLRARHDTVRRIVGSLTDDDSSDLFVELGRGESKPIEHDDSDDDDMAGESYQSNWEAWMPDPIDADPSKTSKSRRSNDILSMLVQIYGSKELFVTEYRFILAEKLLKKVDYDTDKEVRTLELLKLRFGESSMHQCEIMVKDMADSRRVNLLIQQKKLKENQPVGDSKPDAANESFSSTIVSRHFWPPFKGEEVELHENLRGMYDDFSRGYSALKAPRSLEWKTQLGFVELEIEIGGVTREFSVTPSLATVLLHFKDNKTRSVEELCDLMKVESGEEKVVKSYISYWVGHGVIEESTPGHYSQVKVLTTEVEKRSSSAVVVDAGDAENVQKAKEAELAAEMKIYESYIVGMLRNFSTLPVDRIHDMLKMFVSTGEHKYDKKIGDLQLFLNQLCAEEKIETDGVSFSLPKNS